MSLKTSMRRICVLAWSCAAMAPATAMAAQTAKPNVLIVLTDDQGYADLGCHGNRLVQTPAMDRFARESVELTSFYACPVCSPSRAALLTGRYPLRSGVVDVFGDACRMRSEEVTLAEALSAAGYVAGMAGKWHLGDGESHRPGDQGFADALTYPGIAPRPYYHPALLLNGRPLRPNGYCTDIFADHAIAFFRANKDRPFFFYLSTNLIHTPLEIAEEETAPLLAAGLDGKTAKVYAMLQNLDRNFGRVLAALKDLGLEENTLVLFTSDNGPCTGSTTTQRPMAGLRGLKGTVYENGIRVPCFVRWPRGFRAGTKVERAASLLDVMPTILEACGVSRPSNVAWDGASLMPLLRSPDAAWPDRTLFFQWEGTPEPHAGRCFAVRNDRWKLVQAVGIADRQKHIRAKYAELCAAQGRGTLTVEGEPRLELFDIAADPGETRDLARENPAVVQTMRAQYDRWFNDVWTSRQPHR